MGVIKGQVECFSCYDPAMHPLAICCGGAVEQQEQPKSPVCLYVALTDQETGCLAFPEYLCFKTVGILHQPSLSDQIFSYPHTIPSSLMLHSNFASWGRRRKIITI